MIKRIKKLIDYKKLVRSQCLIILCFTLTAYSLVPEKNIYTIIDIKAPPAKVWQVLADNRALVVSQYLLPHLKPLIPATS